jgi:hypothetical protein
LWQAVWEPSRANAVQRVGAIFAPDGVNDIEMRLWVAYGLIALMLAAAVASVAYIRHNRPDRKYLRQREREDQKSRDRLEASNTPE